MEPYLKRGLREKGLDIIPLNIGNKTHEVLGVATAGEKISHTVFGVSYEFPPWRRKREREKGTH
jgi:hypothetical protein